MFTFTALPDRLRSDRGLIIGYGNTLRGDDQVGVLLAETLEQALQARFEIISEGVNPVQVVATPQLLPELAAPIATVDWVIFLDAIGCHPELAPDTATIKTADTAIPEMPPATSTTGLMPELAMGFTSEFTQTASNVFSIHVQALQPSATHLDPHTSSPEALLGLAYAVFGQCPTQAWLVGIPAMDFSLGASCSEVAIAGMVQAWQWLAEWLKA